MIAIKKLIIIFLFLNSTIVFSIDTFIIKKVTFEGLHNFSYDKDIIKKVTFLIGNKISNYTINKIMKILFSTNNFEDIKILKSNDILIIKVKEKPIISNIKLENNISIKNDILKKRLEYFNVKIGKILHLENILFFKQELEEFYSSIGKLNSEIHITLNKVPFNRVNLTINFFEGLVTKIKNISIIGNKKFTYKKLINYFPLENKIFILNIRKNPKFEKQNLLNSIENLKKFYFSQGYLFFNIEFIHIHITPDKKYVYINIHIKEGSKYNISKIDIRGNINNFLYKIKKISFSTMYSPYNQEKIKIITKKIKKLVGYYGYANPYVFTKIKIDKIKKNIILNINIDIGKRYYVRNIYFLGNYISQDIILRRNLKQLESNIYNYYLINEGKKSLEKTGYFENVNVFIKPVLQSQDQIDVIYKIIEHSTGNFNLSAGYGNENGITLHFNAHQDNWFGSGNNLAFYSMRNQYRTYSEISFLYPYITTHGVSLNNRIFYNNIHTNKSNVTNINNKSYGIDSTLGFPINKKNTLNLGLGYIHNNLFNIKPQVSILRYLASLSKISKNNYFTNDFTLNYGWTFDTLNKEIFSTIGQKIDFNGKITLPGSKNDFYKFILDFQKYIPLNNTSDWIFLFRGRLGYGNSIKLNQELAFYENFQSNGLGEVRGFRSNHISPKAIYFKKLINYDEKTEFLISKDPIGGNIITVMGIELIIKNIIFPEKYSKFIRTSLFFDAGAIWNNQWKNINIKNFNKIQNNNNKYHSRISCGISMQWMSPFGLLVISYSKPLKIHTGDIVENFQFSIGKSW